MSRVASYPLLCLAVLGLSSVAFAQDAERKAAPEPRQPLAMINYELTLVQLAPAADAAANDTLTQSKAAEDLPAALKAWQAQGRIKSLKSMRLNACDNQSAYVQFGEKRAIATGTSAGPRGRNTSYQYEDIGLIFGITGRLEEDKTITAELDIKHSDIDAPAEAAPKADEGTEITPPSTLTNQVQTTVRLHDGKTLLIGGGMETSPSEDSVTLLFVTARVAE